MFNVLYGGDRLTLRGIYLSMRSMLEYNRFPIHFYVLTMSLNNNDIKGRSIIEEDRLFLEKMAKRFNKENIVELLDYTSKYQETIKGTKNEKCRFSPYCMLRLFSEDILPDENLLYLDADTLINGPLDELIAIDITDVELIANLDYLGQWWVHPGYFNSGVLYINGKLVKERKLFSRSIDLLMQRKLFFADQSALNINIKDFRYMPRKFNEQRAMKKDTIIAHFCNRLTRFWSPIRPWDVEKMHKVYKIHDFDKIYKDYLNEFPFEKIGLEKPNYKF